MHKDPPREWLTEEEKKDFRIRFDVIVKHDLWGTSNWKEHPATLAIASMLPKRDIEELFQEVIDNEPMVQVNMLELREWLKLAKSDELSVKEENRKLIRNYLDENRGAGAGDKPFDLFYIYEHRYFGMNLNQPIEVGKEDKNNFRLLFSFRLSKTNYPNDFLSYHLIETFRDDKQKYRLFIREIQYKCSDLVGSMKTFINQWVEDELIKNYGYDSRVVSKVEEIVSKHHQPFGDFYSNEIKKDTRYWLTTIETNQAQTSNDYKRVKDNIDTNGHFIIETTTDIVKVYSLELAFVFCSNTLFVKDIDTQTETIINGSDYIQSYVQGYNEGQRNFDSNFAINPTTMYGENAERYVRDIQINYFHSGYKGDEGWNIVKMGKIQPLIITHKSIKEIGYYSGIVSKVDEMVLKFPSLFETFSKYYRELTTEQANPKKTETKTDKLKEILTTYGFRELSKVSQLSDSGKQSLIELISTNDLPYSIAMLEFLGFLKHLKTEYFNTNDSLFKEVAKWFDVTDRVVKGNINVLNVVSKENRERYTADQQKQTVLKHYEELKSGVLPDSRP